MITRILNSRLPLIIYNPIKVVSIDYFTSIDAAGALPVFDTEFLSMEEIFSGVEQLMDADINFGIRLGHSDPDLMEGIRALKSNRLDLLIAPLDKTVDPDLFNGFRETKIALEITGIDCLETIQAIDPHLLILRGNETGGRVSRYSSFILMQWYQKQCPVPIMIHGGVGHHTAAGMFASGVSGVVLDSQVWLAEESPVADSVKSLLRNIDENDSLEITTNGNDIFRVFAKLGTKIAKELKEKAILVSGKPDAEKTIYNDIAASVCALDDTALKPVQSLFFLGQDGLFAKDFAREASTLKEIIAAFFRTIREDLDLVDRHDPVVPESPLAREHGTRLPLIQGPMANISDNSEFALKVLQAGALPFFAVGSLPESLADTMLKSAHDTVKNYGAGLVGIEAFNPAVNAHMAMVKKYKAPFALFAGGVPSQIIELEKAGTKAYLHTPSMSMLENALKNGCTRFIVEGKEAGGHIGSLSSLVLWEAAISALLKKDPAVLANVTLVFAGGISTCFASCFISGIASVLAAKGVKIGIQVGSAYLFTREIVDTGSMTRQYQEIISQHNETMVIGQSVGLASRTAPTEFARMMIRTEKEMIKNGESLDNRKKAFEKKNIGSLLIGAKGFLPDFKKPGAENYTWFEGEDHRDRGNFLVGDSLAFFRSALSIDDIHTRYFDAKPLLVRNLGALEALSSPNRQINDEIAVIGMGCVLPDADSPETLWDNILKKKYSIRTMPDSRMSHALYYDPDKSAEDRTYTLLAGTIENYVFDQERYGYDDEKSSRLSRSQKILLEATYQAVERSGYLGPDLRLNVPDPERTAVIIATCLGNELGNDLQLKYHFPEVLAMAKTTQAWQDLTSDEQEAFAAALLAGMEGNHPGYDPVHGIPLNIEASRVARHLGVRGPNYIVDAACASSITAIEAAQSELLSGDADQVIVGGVNTHLAPESFVGFSKMGALSASGSYPFDQRADGFVLGEGAVVFVLKRMKDAMRDKDPILGIIKAIGSSSDGRGKAIAAPNPAGQKLALERCFEKLKTRIRPEDIRYIEAHGTSTIMGDQAEIETLKSTYANGNTGISSIKSQIGHLLGCAGAAGLIKALLAVKNGVLPPNGNFDKLSSNHSLDATGLYIITDPQPWTEKDGSPRKAGISSYGFGGINYHMIIEEFQPGYKPLPRNIFSDLSYDFNDDRIVVAGMGVCLPGAPNLEAFWEKLESGEKQLSMIPEDRFNNQAYASLDKRSSYRLPLVKAGVITDFKFNNAKYRMPPKTVRSIERGQLIGLDAADEAIANAGIQNLLAPGNRTGVILGTIPGERQTKNILRVRKGLIDGIIRQTETLPPEKRSILADQVLSILRDRIPENNEDTTPGLLSNIISGRIANHFGLNGVNYVIDASCASSVIAIRNAARSIVFKEHDFILAGGVDANLYPAVLMAFKRLGLLSEGDCNFFDSRADGYVMGEGAAIHVITTLKKAKEHGLSIVGELNHCTVKSSAPDHLLAPSEQTFVATINETYAQSSIRKKEINHLDLFAFSNILGDMIEKQVTEKCFHHEVSIGNIKPQFGYFKAANPAVAMVKLMLMNKKKTLLPDFNYSKEHSTLTTSRILKPLAALTPLDKEAPVRLAMNVNGIGGNHCHMIITTLPSCLVRAKAGESVIEVPVTASAPSAQDVQNAPAVDIPVIRVPSGKTQRMIALLSGQGAQRPGMMHELYQHDIQIRNILDRGEELFTQARGYSLLDMMFGNDDQLNLTQNTQPAIFLSSAALFDRLQARGFSPDYFIGHSVGEYTALFCSGMLDFDDAMKLIIKRSDLMRDAAVKHPGRIMVVFRNEKETSALMRESYVSDIYITNKNSENQTAVSGNSDSIDAFCEYLASQNIVYKKLNLSGAFHTPLFDEAAEKLRDYLATITFNEVDFSRVISNVTARPYPANRREVKDLLAKQITSPVEFIRSVESVYLSGSTHYIEIGPGRLLANLLKNINIAEYQSFVAIDVKQGEINSFEACKDYIQAHSSIFTRKRDTDQLIVPSVPTVRQPEPPARPESRISIDDDFSSFKKKNMDLTERLLYEEFQRRKREAAMDAVERFDFNTEKIVISGVSAGLPGKAKRVFASDNFDSILDGNNFIEPLTLEDQKRIADKNITRLFKQPDGNARFVEITKTEDVIHLAGQLGFFDLNDEYGIKNHYDISMALAVAAGIEALKDAGIPLVMQYKTTAAGDKMIPDGFALPEEMQEETGIIITSLFPNNETLINEMEKYFYDKLFLKPYEEFENIYFYLMENVKDLAVKEQITDWFFKVKTGKRTDLEPYRFDRNFLANACPLGAAFLAQVIRAKGPNTLLSSACASTTQAIGVAEDWIRVGRCKRVLVIGGENATSPAQNQWIGSGFLALGAATVKKRISEAAKPFDADRNGTIIGSGAVGLVIEAESRAKARGMNGQAEILGTHMANSAFHTFNIDVPHMAREMQKFITMVERRHDLNKADYADKLLFMSHETYTPARGGSADAEVTALKTAFDDYLKAICISNTKGFTGHTLGAAIEDVVMVKALQKRKAPPIANLKTIPDHFRELNFSTRKEINSEYGLHLAAGFGSHFAFLFVKRIQENTAENNPAYQSWLQAITGSRAPELRIIDNTLCVIPGTMDSNSLQPMPSTVPEPREAPAQPVKAAAASPIPPAESRDQGHGILETVKTIIAEQTGYTIDMLEDDLDLEADLGIDTVKQVEIFGKSAAHFGFQVPEDLKLRELNTIAKLADYVIGKTGGSIIPVPAEAAETPSGMPAAEPAVDILAAIKTIIADQTGYTTDMLEEDLDLEADLGIDTVKQVEIFGKSAAHFGFQVPEDLKLRELNTIAKLAAYIIEKTGGNAMPAPAETQARETVSGASTSDRKPARDIDTGAATTLTTIKEIIAEQTGYTTDMLEEDLDLEADLGIDTVKQVEIFGKSAAHFEFQVPEDLKLRELNTIAKLAAYIDAMSGPVDTPPDGNGPGKAPEQPSVETPSPANGNSPAPVNGGSLTPVNGKSAFPDPASPIKRLIVRTIQLDPCPKTKADFAGKTFLVTEDTSGFAKQVIAGIQKRKGTVITLGSSAADHPFEFADITDIEQRVADLKTRLPEIHGLIHLAGIDFYAGKDAPDDAELNTTVKSAFALIKGLYDLLDKPGTLVATLTFNSVVFPYMDGCGPIHSSFGSLAGLLKTVNKELDQTLVKVVDFADSNPRKHSKAIAETFLKELLSGDPRVETGYRNGERYGVSMKQRIARRDTPIIRQGSTLLVTGGAGGITYEILKSVVAAYKTNLVILDINDIFGLDSKFLAPDLAQPQIMAMLKQDQPGAKPLDIKKSADRIMRTRQSVSNIETLKSMGITVDYHVADVTSLDMVKQAVDAHPVIDGIFHAAGMEMSQVIPKKAFNDFQLVVDVKVKGMRNLLQAMEGRDYSFAFTFSSVTARFGNEGQSDYTAANDGIGKLLFRQKQQFPDRVFKVYAWTAWSGTGMATNPTVMQVLKERGIQFLPMDQGVKFFMADLLDRSESEMVFSGMDYSFDRDGLLGAPGTSEFPFLDEVIAHNGTSVTYSRTLDLKRDLFLADHAIDNVPLFLGSTGIETLAEVAASLARENETMVELTDFSIPYGIKILKGRPKELMINAEKTDDGIYTCSIVSQFKNPKGVLMGDPTLHYKGTYRFDDAAPEPERITLPEFRPVTLDGEHREIVYHPKRLFMNGLFETITDVNSFDGKHLVTTVKDASDKEFFKGVKDPALKTPVILIDAMFQTGGLFEFFTSSQTVLPFKIKRLKIYQKVERNREYYCITTKTADEEETNTYQLQLTDKQGNLFISVEDFQMVKLNKIEEEDRINHRVHY